MDNITPKPTLGGILFAKNATATIGQEPYHTHCAESCYGIRYYPNQDRLRFELRAGDKVNIESNERCELAGTRKWDFCRPISINFQLLIEEGINQSSDFCVIAQLHATEDAEDIPTSPILALEITRDERLRLVTRGSAVAAQKKNNATSTIQWRSEPIIRGKWMMIRISTYLSYRGDGWLRIYIDEAIASSSYGLINAYNDQIGPYWKFGIYRSPPPLGETLVVEFKNMRITHSDL